MIAQIVDGERPDGGPHDGVREAQADDGRDGIDARGTQGHDDQQHRQAELYDERIALGDELRHKDDAAKIANQQRYKGIHAKVVGNIGRNIVVVAVWDQRVDGDNLGTHIEEYGENAQPKIGIVKDAALLLPFLALFELDFGKTCQLHKYHQRNQYRGHNEIRQDDAVGELLKQSLLFRTVRGDTDLLKQVLFSGKQRLVKHQNANHSGEFVADAHNAHTAGGRFHRTQHGDVGIAGCLQQRESAALQEQAQQEKGVAACHRARHEHHATDGHDDQAQRHPVAIAGLFQHVGRGYRHHKIGDIEGEGHQIALHLRGKFTGGGHIRD